MRSCLKAAESAPQPLSQAASRLRSGAAFATIGTYVALASAVFGGFKLIGHNITSAKSEDNHAHRLH